MQHRKADDYKRENLEDAIRRNPETWAGAVQSSESRIMLGVDLKLHEITSVETNISDANIKLFKEILSNATDNAIATVQNSNLDSSGKVNEHLITPQVGKIEVFMSEDTITVRNGGDPFPIAPCGESTPNNLVTPAKLVLGSTYSGTNTGPENESLGAGKNGIGAKLTNLLSNSFSVRAGNKYDGQECEYVWTNQMDKLVKSVEKPGFVYDKSKKSWVINTRLPKYTGPNYTEVTYSPNFERYNWDKYTIREAMYFANLCLFASASNRVVIEFTCTIKGNYHLVMDYRNPVKLMGALGYSNLNSDNCYHFFSWNENATKGQLTSKDIGRVTKEMNIAYAPKCKYDIPELEIYMFDTPTCGKQYSFVNGNETVSHGIHVDGVIAPILQHMQDIFQLTRKPDKAKVFAHITIIVLCRVPGASYDGQAKDRLTGYGNGTRKTTKFNMKGYNPPFQKWEAYQYIVQSINPQKPKKAPPLKKHIGVDKHTPANYAGTPQGHACTLYLPEGESAKAYPENMITMKNSKNYEGIYPLRGKIMNVVKMSKQRIEDNKVIQDLVQIIGLREGVDYTLADNVKTLRYGYVCLIVDADVDGDHIKCLFINMLVAKYPSFLYSGRVSYYETPVIRVLKGKRIVQRFYSEDDFDEWCMENDTNGYEIRYLKGLASSKTNDVRDDLTFSKRIVIEYTPEQIRQIMVGFGKDTTARKTWMNYQLLQNTQRITDDGIMKVETIPIKSKDIPLYDYRYSRRADNIMNADLVKFSLYTLGRAIMHVNDGLKRCQRQAMWAIYRYFRYNPKAPSMKVNRIGSQAASDTHYRHGETSMYMTIMRMTQQITGVNNIALFEPDGMFGSRTNGGQDIGDSVARYASIKFPEWATKLTTPKLVNCVPRVRVDGDILAEVEYMPLLINIAAVNGCNGTGTGYSTLVPQHNIHDVISWYIKRCDGKNKKTDIPLPWYYKFTGKVIVYKYNLDIRDFSNMVNAEQAVNQAINGTLELQSDDDTGDSENDNDCLDINTICSILKTFGNKSGEYIETQGRYETKGDTVRITELPIGMSPSNYRKMATMWIDQDRLKDYNDRSHINESTDDYVIDIELKGLNKFGPVNMQSLALITKIPLTNMVALTEHKIPIRFNNIGELLNVHYIKMLKLFAKVKQNDINQLVDDIQLMDDKIKFIQLFIDEKIKTSQTEKYWLDAMLDTGINPANNKTLLCMNVRVLTSDEQEKLRKKKEATCIELNRLRETTENDIYKDHLKELKASLAWYPTNNNRAERK